MRVWLDGRLVGVEEARISPLDRGFLYGDGLFETLRTYRGKPFLLREHLARLAKGCEALELPPPDGAALVGAVGAVVEANGLAAQDARVRITVTRGAGAGDPWASDGPATTLVTAQPLDLPAWLAAGGGAKAILSAQRAAPGPRLKSTSFQPHLRARAEARRAGAWEAILLNERGEVAEGAMSNVFVLDEDGALRTPPPDAGVLPGLTRAVVLGFAQEALCLEGIEAPVTLDALRGAREAFLTSSVAEVVPLVALDGKAVGDGAPGSVTKAVREAYHAVVERAVGNGKPM